MSNLPDKPNHLPEKPGGRVFHEEDQESIMTDAFARQIEEHILINHKFLNRTVDSVRTVDHAGWDKQTIVVTFTDGTALGISGRELALQEYVRSPSDEQLFEAASRADQ